MACAEGSALTRCVLFLVLLSFGCDKEKPKPPEPAAAVQHTSAPTQPAAPKFLGIARIIDVIPKNLRPDDGVEWTDLKIAAANQILDEKAVNQLALTHAKVNYAEITPGGEYAGLPRVLAQQPDGVKTQVTLWFYFPKTALTKTAVLNKNDPISVTGKIVYAKFDQYRVLTINFRGSEVTQPEE